MVPSKQKALCKESHTVVSFASTSSFNDAYLLFERTVLLLRGKQEVQDIWVDKGTPSIKKKKKQTRTHSNQATYPSPFTSIPPHITPLRSTTDGVLDYYSEPRTTTAPSADQ